MSKLGLEQTRELKDFLLDLIKDIGESLSDDGKISTFEALQLAMENAPGAVVAFKGYDNIDDELKDADPEELKELAGMGMELITAAMAAFAGKEKE